MEEWSTTNLYYIAEDQVLRAEQRLPRTAAVLRQDREHHQAVRNLPAPPLGLDHPLRRHRHHLLLLHQFHRLLPLRLLQEGGLIAITKRRNKPPIKAVVITPDASCTHTPKLMIFARLAILVFIYQMSS